VFQQSSDILTDVMIACAFAEIFRIAVVMLQRDVSQFFQIFDAMSHSRNFFLI